MIFLTREPGVGSAGRRAESDRLPSLPGLPAHDLRLIRPDERARFDELLCTERYLRHANLVGEAVG